MHDGNFTAEFLSSVLCDPSSIESIRNSNHTIEQIQCSPEHIWNNEEGILIGDLVELNKNPNKEQVSRIKILRYYFAGEFIISPFSTMSASVLPNIMSVTRGYQRSRQSGNLRAIARLARVV